MTVPWETRARARRLLADEQGAVTKDWGGRIATALLYPNSYHIGMSSLGFQAVYALLNSEADIVCERVFVDSPRHLKTEGVVSIESQRELWEFAVIAMSLTFELDYWNAIAALDAAGVPVLGCDRDERHPLVIAGGPAVTANPEPMAPFIDAFVIGEAEPVLPAVVAALRQDANDRHDLLVRLGQIPGVYVPSLYSITHHTDGTVEDIVATHPAAPLPVQRQWVRNLDEFETSSQVMTRHTEFGDMYLVEVARGCSRQCRFCLAGFCFLPKRERSPSKVLAMAKKGLEYRNRIGLVGAAVSDYSAIDEVSERLLELGGRISVSSLRVDSLSPALVRALAHSGTKTLTLAPEVGSDRLSRVIGKGIRREQVLNAAADAAKMGIRRLKLYYMIGLPTETDRDVQDIVDLTIEVQRAAEARHSGGQVTVNVAPFVPKAHTPFERLPMCDARELHERLVRVQRGLRQKGIDVKEESAKWAAVQGVLARGDRRLADVLIKMARQPTLPNWRRALDEAGLREDFYLQRQRAPDEKLPWKVVSTGVVDQYLHNSKEKGLLLATLEGCGRSQCRKCGVCSPSHEADRPNVA